MGPMATMGYKIMPPILKRVVHFAANIAKFYDFSHGTLGFNSIDYILLNWKSDTPEGMTSLKLEHKNAPLSFRTIEENSPLVQ